MGRGYISVSGECIAPGIDQVVWNLDLVGIFLDDHLGLEVLSLILDPLLAFTSLVELSCHLNVVFLLCLAVKFGQKSIGFPML